MFPFFKKIKTPASEDSIAYKHIEAELREQENYAQSLLRLSRRLEQSQTYAEALNAARDEVKAIIGYTNLWVYLITEDKKHCKALVAGGPLENAITSEEGAATLTIEGDPMLEEILTATEIVIVEDARIDKRTNKEIVNRLGNRTIVNVPIILVDQLLGAVGTGTFGEEGVRVPSISEQKYLTILASHMAVTLDRIRLLIERKKAEEERVKYIKDLENINSLMISRELKMIDLKKENERLKNLTQK